MSEVVSLRTIIKHVNKLQDLVMKAPLRPQTKIDLYNKLGMIADEINKSYRGEAGWIQLERLFRG
jgi:hypothetical protein